MQIITDALDDVESEEDHQTVHQYPEYGERHRLTHDVTILTLHVAGSCGNRYGLWREQFTTLGASTVGGCQPVGLITRNAEERALIHQSEVSSSCGLQLTEEDIRVGS